MSAPILECMEYDMDSTFYIHLNITTTEFLNYYAKNISSVIATSHNGKRVQFPANVLQSFVTHSGVQGTFKLVIDKNSKFKSIYRIS